MIKIKKIIFASFLIISLIIICLNISLFNNLQELNSIFYGNERVQKEASSFHIALIFQSNDIFNELISQGAKEAAEEEKINIKISSADPGDLFTVNDYFELALLSDYDGIIVDGENPELLPLITEARDNNIPVVTIISDLPNSRRISYVGANDHQSGYLAGRKILNQIGKEKPRLAIVSTDNADNSVTPIAEYLKVFGFQEAVYSQSGNAVITWKRCNPNMMDSLQIIRKLIRENPDVNGIFTTHPVLTISAATVISSLNKKDIAFIGYGNEKEIIEYIKAGTIQATLSIDPYIIGKNAVKEITTYLREQKVNLYTNIDIEFITTNKLSSPYLEGN